MTEMGKSLTYIGTAVVVLAVALLTRPKTIEYTPDKMVGKPLCEFDVLAAKRLKIVKFDEEQAKLDEFEVAQSADGRWTIPSKNGYPADAKNQMVDAATLVSGRKVLRIASTDAADHAQLGVIDPTAPNLTVGSKGVGIHMTIQGANGNELADLIIGEKVKDTEQQHYVRKDGKDPTYVVEIDPTKLSTRFEDWIEKDLLKLNTWDIQTIELKDYKLEEVLTPNGPAVMIDGKSEMTFSYDNTDSKWNAETLRVFSIDDKKYVDAPLTEDEELNATKLNDLKNSLGDLKIVDIERKPEGLSRDLQASEDFVKSTEAVISLASRGFRPIQGDAGKIEILSTDGECICTMKNGVEYVMRFGNPQSTSSGESQADNTSDEQASSKDSLRRYLFVMARFNESAIEKPELEELPPLPEGATEPDTNPDAGTPDESTASESPATQPANTIDPAGDPSADPSNDPDSAADNTPDPAAASPGKASDSEPEAAGDPAATTEDATGNGDTAAGEETAAAGEETAAAGEETAAADPETESADAAEGETSELEKAIEQRKTIEAENQRKLDEYKEKIQEGKDKVKELNDRFGDWYYVIDDDVYKKIHLSREDVLQKKEPESDTESETVDDGPIDAAGFGKPGESIPGLPTVPDTSATEDKPAVDKPAVDKPAVDEPAVDEPAVDEPAVDEPAVDEPAVDEPAVDEPAVDEPAVDEPAVDEPAVDEPAADEPTETEAAEDTTSS